MDGWMFQLAKKRIQVVFKIHLENLRLQTARLEEKTELKCTNLQVVTQKN